jgi:hypothetical protein
MKTAKIIILGALLAPFSIQAVDFESDGTVTINQYNCDLAQERLNDLMLDLDNPNSFLKEREINKEIKKVSSLIAKCVKKGFLNN